MDQGEAHIGPKSRLKLRGEGCVLVSWMGVFPWPYGFPCPGARGATKGGQEWDPLKGGAESRDLCCPRELPRTMSKVLIKYLLSEQTEMNKPELPHF